MNPRSYGKNTNMLQMCSCLICAIKQTMADEIHTAGVTFVQIPPVRIPLVTKMSFIVLHYYGQYVLNE